MNQLSAPCRRCGRPSAPDGEHHHPHKGMGGQGPKVPEHPRVALCRSCHSAVHLGTFRLEVTDNVVRTIEGGAVVSERALVDDDQSQDWRAWTDEALAQAWHAAEMNAIDCLAEQCRAAYCLYLRYRFLPAWYEAVAEIVGRITGRTPHPRRVYERVRLYQAFEGRWEDYAFLGARIAIAVAEDAEPERALSIATVAKADGLSTNEVVEMIRDPERPVEYEPPERHACPECGAMHRIRKG